jgi:hypothetical protein
MKPFLSFFVLALLVGAAVALACSDPLLESYCTGIPEGGCPSDDPSTCAHDAGPDGGSGDPSCAALYTHSPSCVWTFVQKCAGFVPPKDAARDANDGADAAFEGGCPALESPDCPLDLVDCGKSCCGCETLYVCNDGGWNLWGQCPDGGVTTSPSP